MMMMFLLMIHITISAKLFINVAMNPLYFEIIDSFCCCCSVNLWMLGCVCIYPLFYILSVRSHEIGHARYVCCVVVVLCFFFFFYALHQIRLTCAARLYARLTTSIISYIFIASVHTRLRLFNFDWIGAATKSIRTDLYENVT